MAKFLDAYICSKSVDNNVGYLIFNLQQRFHICKNFICLNISFVSMFSTITEILNGLITNIAARVNF